MPSKSPRKKPATTTEERSLAEKHLGIIAQRVFVYWKLLPESVRSYYDADDMIGDVVLQVWRVSPRYDPKRAKESTWIWHVANNQCRSILARYRLQKYATIQAADLMTAVTEKASSAHASHSAINGNPATVEGVRLREAYDAVERVIQSGSAALRDFLQQVFHQKLRRKPPHEILNELREVSRRCRASLSDFEIVYRYVAQTQ
jgi:DNA-directed RNA polymerase specialized sigma24 family protein